MDRTVNTRALQASARLTFAALACATLLVVGSGCDDGDAGASDAVGDLADSSSDVEGDTGDSSDGPDAGDSDEEAGDTDRDDTTPAPVADTGPGQYVVVGAALRLDASGSEHATTYVWGFDTAVTVVEEDGPSITVTFAEPGRHRATLTVRNDSGDIDTDTASINVTYPLTHTPVFSSSISRIDEHTIAVVASDADEVTLIDIDTLSVVAHYATCSHPRTVTGSASMVAVACQDDDTVQLIERTNGTVFAEHTFRHGARPFGIVATDCELAVTLQGTGRVALFHLCGGNPLIGPTMRDAIEDARGIARLDDRYLVTRWRSPDDGGEYAIVDVGPGSSAVDGTRDNAGGGPDIRRLVFDDQTASDTESGGVPSYLNQVLVSPTGRDIALPSLIANIGEGGFRSDVALRQDTTVRALVSVVDGETLTERYEERRQFDDRGFASAAVWSPAGDFLYVAMRGARSVERIDALRDAPSGTIPAVGFAPEGLALSADGTLLFVDAALSRQVLVYDVTDFSSRPRPLASLPSQSEERLSPAVLLGKQLFNDSFDQRLTRDAYIACAHCHLDGESDRRTWDFTDRGEGLRNTISLRGRAGLEHGPLHWSANFDEVQDFEHDIRGPFGGRGLLDDSDWNVGTVSTTLGDPKTGLSADLDALSAYVSSLDTYPRSPHREPDGALSADAAAGYALATSPALGCTTCHSGTHYTDSALIDGNPGLHDVGTLGDGSGGRLGGVLPGIDTPTLIGLWNSPPYLHDGSAATIRALLEDAAMSGAHGDLAGLSAAELGQIEAWLLSLDSAGPAEATQ